MLQRDVKGGDLGFHRLRVWPALALALGFRDLRLNCTGFRALRCVTGCGLGQFLSSGFECFIQITYIFGFSKSYSPWSRLRSKNRLSNA